MFKKTIDIFEVFLQAWDESLISITDLVVDFQIVENINKFFLEGTLTIVDNSALVSEMPLIGHERIFVHVNKGDGKMVKAFRVARIEDVNRINEGSGGVVLRLVSETAYRNGEISFSRHFSGLNTDIIKNIAKDYLELDVNVMSKGGHNYNIVFPYIKPYAAIKQILANTYSDDGSPLFMYERFWEDDVVICSLYDMLHNSNVNKISTSVIRPTQDGQSIESIDPDLIHAEEFRIISAYDSLGLLNKGVFAGTVTDVDVSNKSINKLTYDWKKNITPTGQDWVLAPFNELKESKNHTSIKFGQSFEDLPSASGTDEILTLKRNSYKAIAGSFTGRVRMEGNDKLTAGSKIYIRFPKFTPDIGEGDKSSHLDYDHINSGEFIIASMNHHIHLDQGRVNYELAAEIIRDGVGK